jgi:hypothetical protein
LERREAERTARERGLDEGLRQMIEADKAEATKRAVHSQIARMNDSVRKPENIPRAISAAAGALKTMENGSNTMMATLNGASAH